MGNALVGTLVRWAPLLRAPELELCLRAALPLYYHLPNEPFLDSNPGPVHKQ